MLGNSVHFSLEDIHYRRRKVLISDMTQQGGQNTGGRF